MSLWKENIAKKGQHIYLFCSWCAPCWLYGLLSQIHCMQTIISVERRLISQRRQH